MRRRTFIAAATAVGASALFVGTAAKARDIARQHVAWNPELSDFDMVLGAADAPVTIVEFASFTCPHCARFHGGAFPALKARYIDGGKVRLVFREFPLDDLALRAGMLARCGGPGRYFEIVDALFASQERWARAADPIAELKRIGRLAGLSAVEIDRCLADESVAQKIRGMRETAAIRHGINSTPSFLIEGRRFGGNLSIAEFSAVIDPLLATPKS